MRTYSQIAGDGGSDVAGQVAELEAAIARRLAPVRHLLAIGSGKGGVGKSTLTRQLAGVLAAGGHRIGILDADLNGPSQALLGGVAATPPLPGEHGLVVPRSRDGVRILSAGSVLAEGAALAWPGADAGHQHVWRATREFASLTELLAAVDWGPLDLLLVDLPPARSARRSSPISSGRAPTSCSSPCLRHSPAVSWHGRSTRCGRCPTGCSGSSRT
jgi:ATP-binding protein involved in chromosome partitioning